MINTTFEFNGAIYTTTESGYCYKTENGKKTRIKKTEYDEACKAHEQTEFDEMMHDRLTKVLSNEAYEKALEATETSVETEEVREVAHELSGQEKPKRKPTKRIPKSVGYRKKVNGTEVILTEKQVNFLNHLPDTCYWENGVDSAIWTDCLCDEIGGQFANKPMTVGAMISTLCEKGIGVRAKDRVNGRKCTSFTLTELGKMVARDLGL